MHIFFVPFVELGPSVMCLLSFACFVVHSFFLIFNMCSCVCFLCSFLRFLMGCVVLCICSFFHSVKRHELTHCPYTACCEECVRAEGNLHDEKERAEPFIHADSVSFRDGDGGDDGNVIGLVTRIGRLDLCVPVCYLAEEQGGLILSGDQVMTAVPEDLEAKST